MSGADRRAQQAQLEREWTATANARPNISPRAIPAEGSADYCGPNMRGHRHDFSMKHRDGSRSCWFCCKPKPSAGVAA